MNKTNLWSFVEKEFDQSKYAVNETLFALGNGYIGTRGGFEEASHFGGHDGTFINGFYDYYDLSYGEKYQGYPDKSHAMLNVTSGKNVEIDIKGEKFNLNNGKIRDYKRELDFKKGIMKRTLKWMSNQGDEILLEYERLVSFYEKHLMIINLKITPLNFDGEIKLYSTLDGDVHNILKEDDPRIGVEFEGDELKVTQTELDHEKAVIHSKTKASSLGLCCLMGHIMNEDMCDIHTHQQNNQLQHIFSIRAVKNKTIELSKPVIYVSYPISMEEQAYLQALAVLKAVIEKGYAFYRIEQEKYVAKFWDNSDVFIDGDDKIQQGIRFNMFHLLQSVGKDGLTNISAKGLTGEGYEGHYFWDTEIYILPFFLYTNPAIAKKLVDYRYNLLDQARKRAKEMQYDKGALYPWRTINGEECSAYFPAGTAQYHINADIAYTISKYMTATEDEGFLVEKGAEILFETARLWMEIGHFNQDRFHICCVTGPDEYTAVVNNNVYTNLMAANHLKEAYLSAAKLKETYPKDYQNIKEKINLSDEEIETWLEASESIYIPYDEERGLYPQDDSFFKKPLWDFEESRDKHPLLIHYHPLNIYRKQVCKQADLILAEFLLSHLFSQDQKKRDYDYYEKITTHDSSLSTCIFSIMANELGYYDKAYDYFIHSVRTDMDNTHKNTSAGVHTANMAGAWLSIVFGFGGMREENGELKFSPHLPKHWKEYKFRITYKGRKIEVTVKQGETTFALLEGKPITIYHNHQTVELSQ